VVQGDSAKFAIPTYLCPLDSSTADGRAQTHQKNVSSQLLEWYAVKGANFLHSITMSDKGGSIILIQEHMAENGMALHNIVHKK
jgi:hypothetical protein